MPPGALEKAKKVKIHIITPRLPPRVCGIGDYTASFASAIADKIETTILTAQGQETTPLPGIVIKPVFEAAQPRSMARIAEVVAQDKPDWVLLEFEQFMYGHWGFNPWLPLAIRRIKRRCPNTRFAVMIHERFVTAETWQNTIMASWQRSQYASLVSSADVVFFSIEVWAKILQARRPAKQVVHLPVGSNIPRLPISYEAARKHLDIASDVFVVGLFGTPATTAPALSRVRNALQSVRDAGHNALLLYIGPHSARVQAGIGALPLRAEGALPADEVSRRFAALDAYAVPLEEGVTTRRTTLMTGLQHGVATLGTCSSVTDSTFLRAREQALLLAPTTEQS